MKKHFLRFTAYLFCFILFSSCAAAQPQPVAPPKEENKREADLLELIKLDNTIKLDIRYARSDNFVGKPVYPEARAFLQRPAAEAVLRVHRKLKEKGLGLAIFDGYRPWSITKLFWEVVREDQKKFVADPAKGSKHNRGCAVDLGIYDLKTGKLVPMPSDFDEFTERASPDYAGGTEEEKRNRDLLRSLMESEGFTVNPNEWWHFDYKDWQSYAIYDIPFSAIGNSKARLSEAKIEERGDWKKFFDAADVTGGIVVYDLRQNKFLVFDRERMEKGFPPASTSKIIHSLIFLDAGAVKDADEVFKWNGEKQRIKAWEKDFSLRTAFQASAVWFYIEASKRLGREKMQNYYIVTNYGNRNTDNFGTDYWNKGDLRVTPRQQINFLVHLYENRVPFTQPSIDIVKEIMVSEKTDNYVIRSKTGWSDAFTPQVGWWVGWVERAQNAYFFALQIDIKKDEDAARRQIVTKNILKSLKIIE